MQRNLKINDERVAFEVINDEVIIIDLITGNYFNLNGSAVSVWQMFEYQPTLSALVEALAQQYPESRAAVEESVSHFVNDLLSEVIITQVDAPTANSQTIPSLNPADIPFSDPVFSKYTNMADLLVLDSIHDVDGSGWPNEKKSS